MHEFEDGIEDWNHGDYIAVNLLPLRVLALPHIGAIALS